MKFGTWLIIKLDFYVSLCGACLTIILYNDIIHMGREMIYWSWGVGDVTMKSDFSDHIKGDCLFLTDT